MSFLLKKTNITIMASLIMCILIFSVKPADAVSSYNNKLVTIIYAPYTISYTSNSTVQGWNSSSYSDKIWFERYACNGLIYNYAAYPFAMSVMARGKVYQGNTNVLTFYNYDLDPYSIIYDPNHQPWWGGEMFPQMYMSKSTINKVWVETVWSAEGDMWPRYYEFNHIFYDNGWK